MEDERQRPQQPDAVYPRNQITADPGTRRRRDVDGDGIRWKTGILLFWLLALPWRGQVAGSRRSGSTGTGGCAPGWRHGPFVGSCTYARLDNFFGPTFSHEHPREGIFQVDDLTNVEAAEVQAVEGIREFFRKAYMHWSKGMQNHRHG